MLPAPHQAGPSSVLLPGEIRCSICGRADDAANPTGLEWAAKSPAICESCVIEAVRKAQLTPAVAMRVILHLGGIHSVRCDGDGNVGMTREYDEECDGYLYPNETYVEARYALSGTIRENPASVVTMRHCLSCFARFHLLQTQPGTPDVVPDVERRG